MKRAVLYARVSTDAQQKEGTIESQVLELKRQIVAAGNVLVREYVDDGYSGTLGGGADLPYVGLNRQVVTQADVLAMLPTLPPDGFGLTLPGIGGEEVLAGRPVLNHRPFRYPLPPITPKPSRSLLEIKELMPNPDFRSSEQSWPPNR
jgi:hypothetical protein